MNYSSHTFSTTAVLATNTASLVLSIATTTLTTLLIGGRIFMVSRNRTKSIGGRRVIDDAAEIVIESAALFFVASVAYIVLNGLSITQVSAALVIEYPEVIWTNMGVSVKNFLAQRLSSLSTILA